ncbi:MAG TPA: triple tyrosine motif-containing protein [Verrucomicrobiae bacterium]|nr:triple tyrosine motif-containing protein [Verrucomicrobiae bacterium]
MQVIRDICPVRLCVWWLLLFQFLIHASAADATWSMRSWQASEGLPDDTVVGVGQTPDGFLWVATREGLVRFDGQHFREYLLDTGTDIPASSLEAMLVDKRGRLWIAKTGGILLCVDEGSLKNFTLSEAMRNLQCMSITEDNDGAIWMTFTGGKIIRFQEGKERDLTDQDGLLPGAGVRLCCDDKGQIWIIKAGQLGVFRQGKFVSLQPVAGTTMRIGASHSGGIWICADDVLYKFSEAGGLVECGRLPRSSPEVKPTDVFEDRSGAVWIGTEQAGLFRFNDGGFTYVETSHHEIWPVTEDREGNIWVGTHGGGLNRLRPSAMDLEEVTSSVDGDSAQSICQANNGGLWAATRGGTLVRRQADGDWEPATSNTGWPGIKVNCVAADPAGGLWLGAKGAGLISWRPGETNWTKIEGTGQSGGFARALLATVADEVWIGTERPNMLQRLSHGVLQNFPLPTNSGPVCCMARDAAGNVWAATINGRLLRVSQDKIFDETTKTLPVPMAIESMAATADGSLWIGYGRKGLGRLKNGLFTHVSTEQGLFDDHILQIVPDGKGRLWLAGNQIIFFILENEFDDVAAGRSPALSSVVVESDDGAKNLQTSRGFWPGALRTRSGQIIVPKANGFAVVHEMKLSAGPPPLVVIDRVVVDGHTVAAYDIVDSADKMIRLRPLEPDRPASAVQLPPGPEQVRVEYTSPAFGDLYNTRFKYRLHGLDEKWVDAGDQRAVTYPKLSPGNYQFQVMARHADGSWSRAAALDLTVLPAFWQTWWFRVLMAVLVLIVVAQTARTLEKRRIQLRLEQAEREHALERERTRIAKDIHDDLGANLTEISLLSEIAQSANAASHEVQTDVRQIGEKARALTVLMSEIVWAVNPRNDTLESFVTYVCNFAEDFLKRGGIRCRLDVPAHLPGSVVTSEFRHNLFLVVKEALNNVVKYAQASEVQIRFGLEPDGFKVTITDNGRGIDILPGQSEMERRKTGRNNGLINMRERVEQLGGNFQLISQPGVGTKVEFSVPYVRHFRN